MRREPLLWAGLAVAIAVADYLTGAYIQLTVLYAIPVALAAWYNGRSWGIVLATAMPLFRLAYFYLGVWEPLGTFEQNAINALVRVLALSLIALVAGRTGAAAAHAAKEARRWEETRERLQKELDALHREADLADGAERAQLLNRAGDLCALAGETQRAEVEYGRALDIYLDGGAFGRAEAMCQKLLRYSPDVVRVRGTLAALAIGDRRFDDAAREATAYARAAERTGTGRFAVRRLHRMAELAEDPGLRHRIADLLVELGEAELGRAVRSAADSGSAPATAGDPAERWQRLAELARVGGPELIQRSWLRR
jgi:tetratricopeptide (TPR) repeat protein